MAQLARSSAWANDGKIDARTRIAETRPLDMRPVDASDVPAAKERVIGGWATSTPRLSRERHTEAVNGSRPVPSEN